MSLAAVPPPPEDDDREITPPTVLSMDELLALEFEPVVWTIPGLLARGSCDILAGKAKMGKSRLALSIAVAIAVGGMALGKFQVVQGDVLYLALEDGQRRLQSRLRHIVDQEGDFDRSHFYSSCEWSPLDEGGLDFIEQWIDQVTSPVLIVVDTLKRVKPTQSTKRQLYDNDYDALKPLSDLAHNRDVGVLVIHHTRKAEADDWMDMVSGSIGTTAAVDGVILLNRKRGSKDATLNVANRDLMEELSLAITADDLTGGWRYTGSADDMQFTEDRLAILRRLERQPEGMRTNVIAQEIGKATNATWNLLDKLQGLGLVASAGYGKWRNTIRGSMTMEEKPENTGVSGVTGVSSGAEPGNLHRQPSFNGVSTDPISGGFTLSTGQVTPLTPLTPPISESDDSGVPF